MFRSTSSIIAAVLAVCVGGSSMAADIEWRPVASSDGDAIISGNQITLPHGGATVTLEAYISGWAPDGLTSFDIRLDSSTLSNGVGDDLTIWELTCTDGDEAFCEAQLGTGSGCFLALFPNGCLNGFMQVESHSEPPRSDFVFDGYTYITGVDRSSADQRYATTLTSAAFATDSGGLRYAASLVLDIPPGAHGTYSVGSYPIGDPNVLINASTLYYEPTLGSGIFLTGNTIPAQITILCGDGTCGADEDVCNCPLDCGPPAATEVADSTCIDQKDNDCDGNWDCADADCATDPACAFPNGPMMALVPVSTTAGTIHGNTVTLPRGSHSIEFEVRFGNWDPNRIGTLLHGWQAAIDSSGYASGVGGFLTPTAVACTLDDDCLSAFGGVCFDSGATCAVHDGCPDWPDDDCGGSQCGYFLHPDHCAPGFTYFGRSDFTFAGVADLASIDLGNLNFRYADLDIGDPGVSAPDPFPAGGTYSGTLRLDTSPDCSGTFTIGFLPPTASIFVNQDNELLPLSFVPAKVVFPIPKIEFRPVGGYGNEITVAPGSRVTLEAYASLWSPQLLSAYQINLDASGYSNGIGADLTLPVLGCVNDADCESALGTGATCNDLGQGLVCSPAFIDTTRSDYALSGGVTNPVVDLGIEPDFQWNSSRVGSSSSDPGGLRYAGTLVVDVPAAAEGTYTFGFDASPDTILLDDVDQPINTILVPAKIHVGACGPSAPPNPVLADDGNGTLVAFRQSRVLSVSGGDPGQLQALRVTFAALPPPFDTWNGKQLFVGKPFGVCESPGQGPASCQPSASQPGFLSATLQCDPYTTDWTLLRGFCVSGVCYGSTNAGDACLSHDDCRPAIVHIQHPAIVPSTLASTIGPLDQPAIYDIQFVNALCDIGVEANYSPVLSSTTSGWGDLAELSEGKFVPPQDLINVFDITAVYQKFGADPLAPSKSIVDMVGATSGPEPQLDHVINTLELVFILDAFTGVQYPFPPEPTPICP